MGLPLGGAKGGVRRDRNRLPDLPANAGGVTVSYFEWAQDQQRYSWSVEEIETPLRSGLRSVYSRRRR